MGKKVGSEKLGSFYSGGRVRKRREWRGIKIHSMIIAAG